MHEDDNSGAPEQHPTGDRPMIAQHPSEQSLQGNGALPIHNAEDLTGADGRAHISLGGQIYTLRITRAGKLILTK